MNTSDFIKQKFLPGDRIEDEKHQKGVILGIADNILYGLLDGVSEPIVVDDKFKRIACYMEADATERYGDVVVNISVLHCGLRHMKPGDVRRSVSGKIVVFAGVDRDGCMYFRDAETDELVKMRLCEIDPGYCESDRL